jgi:WD40 repeat protein
MDATPTKKGRNDTTAFAVAADPSPAFSPRRSPRVKKPPPITPRRFNRFFTPRAVKAPTGNGRKPLRTALRDIPKAALNVRQNDPSTPGPRKRRKIDFSSPSISIPSSPIRHVGFLPGSQDPIPDTDEEEKEEEELEVEVEVEDDSEATTDIGEEDMSNHSKVNRYTRQGLSAGILSLRLGGRQRPVIPQAKQLWLHETANFYSSPTDVNVDVWEPQQYRNILPFCVTSCNTNSLVAVGDEEGYIRIIDSADEFSSQFSRSHLVFKPHDNAIMDLAFSDDDSLIATASGDQNCHVIDVKEQKSIYSLSGHSSSVKRVQFQPGNPHMLVTCARDGDVVIWDTRQNPQDAPPNTIEAEITSHIKGTGPHCRIENAHMSKLQPRLGSFGRADFSVTSLSFINPSRPHLFVTASESDSIVKLWDMRSTHRFRNRTVPISTSAEPKSHQIHRRFGITSLAMNTDSSILYTLCRDHTIYAYSTSHLILGSAPELSETSKPFTPLNKRSPDSKAGLGPMYGFRHPALQIGTFYPKLSVRKATDSHPELLAAGSSVDCAVLFPPHPRYLNSHSRAIPSSDLGPSAPTRPRMARMDSQSASLEFILRRARYNTTQSGRGRGMASASGAADDLPIHYNGTPLFHGHSKEVTGVSWSSEGNLVSISDDYKVRCWREDEREARRVRTGRFGDGEMRVGWGWSGVGVGWDDEE